ncbi:hypothetical protein [Comamonas sp. 26]|uniref:hypothetical protein n=1 Tax=Comamonas sp. 26 TaxID=2035201 RepID=UPI0013045875|nr:hypothetical protein [Comamonas sp. 26]
MPAALWPQQPCTIKIEFSKTRKPEWESTPHGGVMQKIPIEITALRFLIKRFQLSNLS